MAAPPSSPTSSHTSHTLVHDSEESLSSITSTRTSVERLDTLISEKQDASDVENRPRSDVISWYQTEELTEILTLNNSSTKLDSCTHEAQRGSVIRLDLTHEDSDQWMKSEPFLVRQEDERLAAEARMTVMLSCKETDTVESFPPWFADEASFDKIRAYLTQALERRDGTDVDRVTLLESSLLKESFQVG